MAATFKPGFLSPRSFSRRVPLSSTVAAVETADGIVHARGIHKTYDTGAVRTHALRGVDLRLRQDHAAFNCLAGLEDFEAGEGGEPSEPQSG